MNERKIEAILFDLDGVLINSLESWYQALIMQMQKIKSTKESKSRLDG